MIEMLESLDEKCEAEEIQTKIYEIGMNLKFDNLRDWFSAFYQVVLGQEQGPRLGSFIKTLRNKKNDYFIKSENKMNKKLALFTEYSRKRNL